LKKGFGSQLCGRLKEILQDKKRRCVAAVQHLKDARKDLETIGTGNIKKKALIKAKNTR